MWKKLLIGCIALVGTLSVGYAYVRMNTQMNAAMAPAFSLKKGQKVVMGKYNNNEVVWDIGNAANDYVLMSSKLIKENMSLYNASIASSCEGMATDYYCPITLANQELANIVLTSVEINASTRLPFVPSVTEIKNGGSLGLSREDRLFTNGFSFVVIDGGLIDNGRKYNASLVSMEFVNGAAYPAGNYRYIDASDNNEIYRLDEGILIGSADSNGFSLRPFAILNRNQISFAANTTYTDGNWHTYTIDVSNLNEQNELNPVKLRVASSLTADLQDIRVNHVSTNVAIKDTAVQLSVTANSGTNNHISVLLYDTSGDLKYYKMLDNVNPGTNDYALDLTGIPLGSYQLAVINEEYIAGSNLPVESSPISNCLDLEIIDLHRISYTKTPQSGASTGVDYEYDRNVDAGQTIGKITVDITGNMPLTYALESNGDNTYQNFEIVWLDDNQTSSDRNLNVRIKNNAPDLAINGLRAGTYKFCVNTTDRTGLPTTPNLYTKVCTSFNVERTDLSIAFTDPNQTRKSVMEAQTVWNETATATPNNSDMKITYTKVSGDISLIQLDENTGVVTYTGNGAYGKVKIRASSDDDPSIGNDNYNSAFVEKEIVVYREVDGVVTPHADSSDANTPTFSAGQANVQAGGTIGTISGQLGTPDAINSGPTTYTYQIQSGGDASFFTVNSNSGEIKTNANLGVGTYHFTIRVSDHWSSKDIPVTVNVGVAPAEDLKFYESSTSNTVINTKTVNLNDTNISVFAKVAGSTNTNPVTYSLRVGDATNVINVNPNSGAVTILGAGTVKIVARKQGANGQADAQAELTFTVNTGTQNFIYTTDSTLSTERPKTGDHYDALTETYVPNQTFQVYTTGNPSGSIVTYQLKTDSPTDVISVDSDGTIHVLNASLNNQLGRVIVQATSHDPSGNYEDKTIELPININKGTRSVAFADHPIYVLNGSGSVTPTILTDGQIDTGNDFTIETDPNTSSIAWTNDGETIQYTWNDAQGKDINLHVTKSADRNYNVAEADGILHILGADENALTISTPGRIIYGDHFVIRSTQNDSMSTNVQYTFETDNQVFISAPQVTGNRAEFDAIGNSGNTEISIRVTRTADGELPLSKTVKIKVLPKPITIQIENKEKRRLEENPPLTYADFTSQLVEWNGVRDEIETGVLNLSTTATRMSGIGSYPITAGNAERQLNDNYPNYTFTIQEGLMNVLDNGNRDFWDNDNDGCPDVNIQITDEQGNPLTINGDRNDDGIPDYNIDANGDGTPDLNIDTDSDGKPDLNLVILKEWNPTRCVTLNDIQYSSGITAKAEINVDLDGDGIPDIDIDNVGDFKPHINIANGGETPQVNIVKLHIWKPDKDYRKESFTYDSIGKDSEGTKPELNIDTDGDGLPDINLDINNDGKPELNIDWDGDWIPDTQIDSTGDGKADVNIDIDGNGIADENIKEIKEWKPEHNVDGAFPYDTMKFEEVKEPEEPGKDDKSDNEIKGNYYPGTNTGGALTGDTTDLITYMGIGCISLGLICLILFKRKQEKY